MASNILLAHTYLALAALAPASTISGHVHPAHATRAPQPARHVTHGMPLAVTRSSTRVRAGRTSDGQVTLSLV
jgi:hypothetical protein